MQPWTESHVSSVHGSPSSQLSGVAGVQTPLWQVSVPLHTSLSVQPAAGPFATGVVTQVPLGQLLLVHGFPSAQSAAVVHGFTTQVPSAGLQTCPAGHTLSGPGSQPVGSTQTEAP
jgi:hypothetical protein